MKSTRQPHLNIPCVIIIPGVYICVIMLHKGSLYHNNADIISHTILSCGLGVCPFIRALLINCISATSPSDEFSAVSRCTKHSLAGPLGSLCSTSAQDQWQPGSPPPGECWPVWQTTHVTG